MVIRIILFITDYCQGIRPETGCGCLLSQRSPFRKKSLRHFDAGTINTTIPRYHPDNASGAFFRRAGASPQCRVTSGDGTAYCQIQPAGSEVIFTSDSRAASQLLPFSVAVPSVATVFVNAFAFSVQNTSSIHHVNKKSTENFITAGTIAV